MHLLLRFSFFCCKIKSNYSFNTYPHLGIFTIEYRFLLAIMENKWTDLFFQILILAISLILLITLPVKT